VPYYVSRSREWYLETNPMGYTANWTRGSTAWYRVIVTGISPPGVQWLPTKVG